MSNGDTRLEKKLSTANEGETVPLARAGETILETFYGMLYICEDETKEWKLSADGFIPLCFIQERGNANKPFKVIAVHGSTRVSRSNTHIDGHYLTLTTPYPFGLL